MRTSSLFFAASAVLLLASCTPAPTMDTSTGMSSSSVSSVAAVVMESSSSVSSDTSSAMAFDPAALPAYKDACTKATPVANKVVKYEDKANGFAIELPFNDAWGSAPYVKTDDGMHFGMPVSYDRPDGGCANESAFTLTILPKRTAEDALQSLIDDYNSHAMPEPPQGWGVHLVMVDRRAAVQWGIGEWVCPMPTLEIPGTKVNLQLSVACHYPYSPVVVEDQLEAIMQEIRFE